MSFRRQSILVCVPLIRPLTDQSWGMKQQSTWTTMSKEHLLRREQDHQVWYTCTPIHSNAHRYRRRIEGVIQQWVHEDSQALGFFSGRFQDSESSYSFFGGELLAIYCTVRQFQHSMELREFTLISGHKPLAFSPSLSSQALSSGVRKTGLRFSTYLGYKTHFWGKQCGRFVLHNFNYVL